MTASDANLVPTRSIDRTFSVSVPVERAWRAMTDPAELAQWFFRPLGEGDTPDGFDLFGSKTEIEVLDVEPLQRFRYAETGGAVPKVNGYAEVTVTFEDAGSGTRITITRSGFGDGPDWDAAIEMVGRGLEETIADCVLYVETGVSYPRHPARRRATTRPPSCPRARTSAKASRTARPTSSPPSRFPRGAASRRGSRVLITIPTSGDGTSHSTSMSPSSWSRSTAPVRPSRESASGMPRDHSSCPSAARARHMPAPRS